MVQLGQSSYLTWHVILPDGACGAVQVLLNGQAVAENGSHTVTPSRATTYTVTVNQHALGWNVSTSQSARLDVGFPARVIIDGNTRDPVQLLIGALVDSTNPVQVVELCNVDLDLTGYSEIVIGANRSLIASPDCARGPRRLGPRIFVTDKRGEDPLFVIRDNNVRFSGFRLEGPTTGIGSDDDNLEMGIKIWPFGDRGPMHDIEISNMEISHWSGTGINVSDNATETSERGSLTNENVSAVHIKNNYLHHNRHYSRDGYGVDVADGAYALIEQNVFDENRHAIAGVSRNGNDYSGYTARDNLILAGGGVHCVFMEFGEGWVCWQTHQIDMHGDKSHFCPGLGEWCCGTAGETIIIERNTILYTSGNAIKIRGNPADKAIVNGNVFKHTSRGDAISQNGDPVLCIFGDNITNPIDVRPNNVFGFDPMAELGHGDFAGDGQQDAFMATGVTWWAWSPTTHQWRYLNTMRERLPELQLGDFDNDGVCDVALRAAPSIGYITYSKSGTGLWAVVVNPQ